jgi:hypothetical protein
MEEFFAEVKRIWDELDQGKIDRLVSDFPRRCELILARHENSISQLLSSHMTAPRPRPVADLVVAPLPADFDARILQFIDEGPRRPRKWCCCMSCCRISRRRP